MLDGGDQGPNKDAAGHLLTKQCNRGLHFVALQCSDGTVCGNGSTPCPELQHSAANVGEGREFMLH